MGIEFRAKILLIIYVLVACAIVYTSSVEDNKYRIDRCPIEFLSAGRLCFLPCRRIFNDHNHNNAHFTCEYWASNLRVKNVKYAEFCQKPDERIEYGMRQT